MLKILAEKNKKYNAKICALVCRSINPYLPVGSEIQLIILDFDKKIKASTKRYRQVSLSE